MRMWFRNEEQPCFSLAIANKIMGDVPDMRMVSAWKKLHQFEGNMETPDQDSGIRV
jgi:hypothetical protein